MKKKLLMMGIMLMGMMKASAAPDPNFHIYLCFGQSNMEGNAAIEEEDRTDCPETRCHQGNPPAPRRDQQW